MPSVPIGMSGYQSFPPQYPSLGRSPYPGSFQQQRPIQPTGNAAPLVMTSSSGAGTSNVPAPRQKKKIAIIDAETGEEVTVVGKDKPLPPAVTEASTTITPAAGVADMQENKPVAVTAVAPASSFVSEMAPAVGTPVRQRKVLVIEEDPADRAGQAPATVPKEAPATPSVQLPTEVAAAPEVEDKADITAKETVLAEETASADETVSAVSYPHYQPGQWNPVTKTGRCVYDKAFLLAFQPFCRGKPANLAEGELERVQVNQSRTGSGGNSVKQMPFALESTGTGANRGGPVNRRSANAPGGRRSNSQGTARVIKLPRAELKPLDKSGNAWSRPEKANDDDAKAKEEEMLRAARLVLNVIVPQTFDKLSLKLIDLCKAIPARLRDFIDMIFIKALDEPTYSPVYAKLCLVLFRSFSGSGGEDVKEVKEFRQVLLQRCQIEFELVTKESDKERKAQADKVTPSEPPADETSEEMAKRIKADQEKADEEAYQRNLSNKRKLGNIKFIGELYKAEMVCSEFPWILVQPPIFFLVLFLLVLLVPRVFSPPSLDGGWSRFTGLPWLAYLLALSLYYPLQCGIVFRAKRKPNRVA